MNKKCKVCGTSKDLCSVMRGDKKIIWGICETCRFKKISDTSKGRIPWNKGLTKNDSEVIKRMAAGHSKIMRDLIDSGKYIPNVSKMHSKESRKKYSKTMKELYRSGKISPWNKGKKTGIVPSTVFKKGQIPWNKGKKYSIDRSHIIYTEEWKDKIRVANYKENQSEETLRKRREAKIRYIEKTKNDGMPLIPTIGLQEKKILDKEETKIGYKIERQHPVCGFFLDGYCEELNIAYEVDESHHFVNGELKESDIYRQNVIENEIGCEFVRFRVE